MGGSLASNGDQFIVSDIHTYMPSLIMNLGKGGRNKEREEERRGGREGGREKI